MGGTNNRCIDIQITHSSLLRIKREKKNRVSNQRHMFLQKKITGDTNITVKMQKKNHFNTQTLPIDSNLSTFLFFCVKQQITQ